ncbi:MAG: mandelate racemase/muconate lactonizing enzyme family protein [Roseovarius sp.]|nr:mandelate racemase/muconate lactonizing enzyme family protein [Roseovarius sp.]
MRIAQLHVYQKNMAVKDGPCTMSGMTVWSVEKTIVCRVSDTWHERWGEVCPLGSLYAPVQASAIRAVMREIGEFLVGGPIGANTVRQAIDSLVNCGGYLHSAFDIAVHDLVGKSLGVPVATLPGGVLSERLPSCFATGTEVPEKVAGIAREKVEEGYPRIQIKIGGRDVAEDIASVRMVHEAAGSNARLAFDENGGLSMRDAIRVSRECVDVPFIFEQPCDSIREIATIRSQIRHPLYLDESATNLATAISAIFKGLVEGFGMKLSRLGGLRPFGAFMDVCAAHGLHYTCDDSRGGDIVAAPRVQTAAACEPRCLEGVWLATPRIDDSDLSDAPVTVESGHISLPKGAGLGITPDSDRLGPPVASFGC